MFVYKAYIYAYCLIVPSLDEGNSLAIMTIIIIL